MRAAPRSSSGKRGGTDRPFRRLHPSRLHRAVAEGQGAVSLPMPCRRVQRGRHRCSPDRRRDLWQNFPSRLRKVTSCSVDPAHSLHHLHVQWRYSWLCSRSYTTGSTSGSGPGNWSASISPATFCRATINAWYSLGSVLLFIFALQVATGILLLVYYVPDADKAFKSVICHNERRTLRLADPALPCGRLEHDGR